MSRLLQDESSASPCLSHEIPFSPWMSLSSCVVLPAQSHHCLCLRPGRRMALPGESGRGRGHRRGLRKGVDPVPDHLHLDASTFLLLRLVPLRGLRPRRISHAALDPWGMGDTPAHLPLRGQVGTGERHTVHPGPIRPDSSGFCIGPRGVFPGGCMAAVQGIFRPPGAQTFNSSIDYLSLLFVVLLADHFIPSPNL